MKKRTYLLVIIFSLIVTGVDASDSDMKYQIETQASHNIILDAMSWKAFDIHCNIGDTLSGSLEVNCDGSRYFGDEGKYDDWSVEGIQFYIVDEDNFSLFVAGKAFAAYYERNDVYNLNWTFKIPKDGCWYVVYYNDSIYLMNIDGIINQIPATNYVPFVTLVIFGGLSIFSIGLIIKRRYESHG